MSRRDKYSKLLNFKSILSFAFCILLAALVFFPVFRFDLTSEKRYSIAPSTKKLMQNISDPIEIKIYLDGDLNPGFFQLKQAVGNLLEELSARAAEAIFVSYINPSQAENADEREAKYAELADRGMTPTAVYERDKEGKAIQKIIFPWLEITYKNKTLPVSLLKNIRGNSGEENLNISIENLEFEVTDAIRRLTNTKTPKIAFIEGHDEFSEAETYDISKSLSRYFQIDRGVLENDASILNNYQAIIVAGPRQAYSESDKYIIDQYIMHGGRVLWLIDGVRLARENLSKTGISPLIELDVNLSDMLFRYGVRINPVVLQDVQCVNIPVNIAPHGEKPPFEATPWYYAPLLLTSSQHPISRNLAEVKAEFTSSISLVGEKNDLDAYLLLATSDNTHIVAAPATIDLSHNPQADDKNYFNVSFVPVAISLEGVFESNFSNRMVPRNLTNVAPMLTQSKITRQIVIANSEIIRNETNGIASDSTTLPLGFDRYTQQTFGNKEFLQNAVLYLTDNDGWMDLRSRSLKLRLLNKQIINNEPLKWQLINTLIPLVILGIFGTAFFIIRRKRFVS